MYVIPSKETKKFSQPNTGDTGGNLWSTFNVNLSKNKGRVLSTRSLAVAKSTDDVTSTMKLPTAFAYFDYYNNNQPLFFAYAGRTIVSTTPWTGWNTVTISGSTPNITTDKYADVDMKVFNGKLYATTTGTGSHYLTSLAPSGTWSNVATIGSGDTQNLHILCSFKDRLYFTRDNFKIHSMDYTETVATSGAYTVVSPILGGHISWMKEGSNKIWIGWTSNDGSRGSIFEWDGISIVMSKEYKIEAQGSCTCVIKNDIPYILDVEGRLLAFNGSNFQEVARLPIANSNYPVSNYIRNSGVKLCHFNGSLLSRNQLLFNINPVLPRLDRYIENCQPGVWEYSEDSGFTHKYAVSSTKVGASVLEYGQQDLLSVGAMFDGFTTNAVILDVSERQGQILFGARTNETNSPFLICIDNTLDNVKKSSYIITQWLESTKADDVWKNIIVKYRKLLKTTDKIKVKYRTIKEDATVMMGFAWTSTTTLTVNSSIWPTIADYSVGDEIEITSGYGSGKCVNITAITNVGSTYYVSIDEAITSATGSAFGKFQKWIKLQEVQNKVQFAQLPLPQYNKDTQIQIKVIMETTGENELHEVIVVNGTETNAK